MARAAAVNPLEIFAFLPILLPMILVTVATLSAWISRAPYRSALPALVLVVTALLSGCSQSTSELAASRPLIRLGSYEWPGSYWIEVASQKNWFAEEGLNVQRTNVNLRYFESLDDVVTGKLDGMGFSQFDLVLKVAKGHDLVGVAAIDYSEGAEALVARPGLNRLQDLHGKRVALHRGTYLEYLLTIIAERESFDTTSLTFVDRSNDEALADLKAGRVDAVLVWEPYVTDALALVPGSTRLFSTEQFPGLTYTVMTFRRDFVDARPRDIEALLRVWHRAVQYIRKHPDESLPLISKSFGATLASTESLMRSDRILDLADNGRAFSYAAGFESLHGSWRRMNDFMIERGLAAKRVDSPAHLDSRFVRALE